MAGYDQEKRGWGRRRCSCHRVSMAWRKGYQVMQRTPQGQKRKSSYAALACIFVDDLEWVAQASWQTFPIKPRATHGSYR